MGDKDIDRPSELQKRWLRTYSERLRKATGNGVIDHTLDPSLVKRMEELTPEKVASAIEHGGSGFVRAALAVQMAANTGKYPWAEGARLPLEDTQLPPTHAQLDALGVAPGEESGVTSRADAAREITQRRADELDERDRRAGRDLTRKWASPDELAERERLIEKGVRAGRLLGSSPTSGPNFYQEGDYPTSREDVTAAIDRMSSKFGTLPDADQHADKFQVSALRVAYRDRTGKSMSEVPSTSGEVADALWEMENHRRKRANTHLAFAQIVARDAALGDTPEPGRYRDLIKNNPDFDAEFGENFDAMMKHPRSGGERTIAMRLAADDWGLDADDAERLLVERYPDQLGSELTPAQKALAEMVRESELMAGETPVRHGSVTPDRYNEVIGDDPVRTLNDNASKARAVDRDPRGEGYYPEAGVYTVGDDIYRVSTGPKSYTITKLNQDKSGKGKYQWRHANRLPATAEPITEKRAAALGRGSGHCLICNRPLTGASAHIGIGPKCRDKFPG